MGHSRAITGLDLHLRRAVAGLVLAGFGGLDVSVDRAGDRQVSPTGLVLIDDRGALAVVAHPGHQILQARAVGCCEVISGMPEIMKAGADAVATGLDEITTALRLIRPSAA